MWFIKFRCSTTNLCQVVWYCVAKDIRKEYTLKKHATRCGIFAEGIFQTFQLNSTHWGVEKKMNWQSSGRTNRKWIITTLDGFFIAEDLRFRVLCPHGALIEWITLAITYLVNCYRSLSLILGSNRILTWHCLCPSSDYENLTEMKIRDST